MPPRLRQDLYDLAALVTIALGLVALVGWIKTWPGWIVPEVLSAIGAVAYVVIRVAFTIFGAGFAEAMGAPRWAARWEVWRNIVILPIMLTIAVFAFPLVARIIGALVLVAAFGAATPRLVRAAKRRYSDE